MDPLLDGLRERAEVQVLLIAGEDVGVDAAAQAVTGRVAESGWNFWQRSDGRMIYDIREAYMESKTPKN